MGWEGGPTSVEEDCGGRGAGQCSRRSDFLGHFVSREKGGSPLSGEAGDRRDGNGSLFFANGGGVFDGVTAQILGFFLSRIGAGTVKKNGGGFLNP